MCVSPRKYSGHILQSFKILRIWRTDNPWRLCMSDFAGSSLSTRLTMMVSSLTCMISMRRSFEEQLTYRSVNHPFGLYHALVCVGLGGIM